NSLEDTLSHLHRVQKFLGMKPLKSFTCYDVIKNPNIEKFVFELDIHLKEVLDF
ncbi:flavodoxin family protein, partial [Priestia megaterium]